MNKATFLVRFPEFAATDAEQTGLVDACLDEALKAVNAEIWGAKFDQVHALETAHRLAITPFGRNAKLSTATGESTYGEQLRKMRVAAACAVSRQG